MNPDQKPSQLPTGVSAAASPPDPTRPTPVIDSVVSNPQPTMPPAVPAPPTPGTDARYPQTSGDIQKSIDYGKRLGHLKGFVSFIAFIGGVLLAAFLINQFIFQSYFVEGTSMVPTLQNNDRLIIEKVDRTLAHATGRPYMPTRGEIVVLDSSLIAANGASEQLIKRVIGLPGDTVSVKDGVVTVTNKENPDGFNVDKRLGLELVPTYSSQPLTFTVPEKHVFVMGDNRAQNGSHDSRAFGPVPSEKLEGRLWARILPLDKTQIF